MALPIEDYALISHCHTAALVGKDGSIDWLCLPRYDSPSTFGALLGDKNHGRWLIAPTDSKAHSRREYTGNTFILVTVWTTATGVVEVTDFMPHGDRRADVVRRVRGISGSVEMTVDLRMRFAYSSAIPWVRQQKEGTGPDARNSLVAIAGPDALVFRGPELTPRNHSHGREFTVTAGEIVDTVMTWYPSHREPPAARDLDRP